MRRTNAFVRLHLPSPVPLPLDRLHALAEEVVAAGAPHKRLEAAHLCLAIVQHQAHSKLGGAVLSVGINNHVELLVGALQFEASSAMQRSLKQH